MTDINMKTAGNNEFTAETIGPMLRIGGIECEPLRVSDARKLSEWASDRYLQALYLDYLNNGRNVEAFASQYGMAVRQAEVTIEEGRAIHERHAAEYAARAEKAARDHAAEDAMLAQLGADL